MKKNYLIPEPQQMLHNRFFIEFSHLVTLNFYYRFDGLLSIFVLNLAIWIKLTFLNR